MRPLMSCRELIEFLDAYVADEVEAPRRAEFERHLELCEACRAYLDSYRAAIRLGRAALEAHDGDVPEACPEELVRAVLAARRSA